jgi:hypothetical protein
MSIYGSIYGAVAELPLSDPHASQEQTDALRRKVTRRTIGVISMFAVAGICGTLVATAAPAEQRGAHGTGAAATIGLDGMGAATAVSSSAPPVESSYGAATVVAETSRPVVVSSSALWLLGGYCDGSGGLQSAQRDDSDPSCRGHCRWCSAAQVAAAMEAAPHDRDVQSHGCYALTYPGGTGEAAAVAAAGGAERVAAAMARFPDDVEVQYWGGEALDMLAEHGSSSGSGSWSSGSGLGSSSGSWSSSSNSSSDSDSGSWSSSG